MLTHVPESAKAPSMISILEHTNLFQRVIHYPLQLRSLRGARELRAKVSAGRFQIAIHLAESRGRLKSLRDLWFFRSCGIRRVFGVPWRHDDLVCQEVGGTYEWEAQRLARRVAALGAPDLKEDRWWDLCLTRAELAEADRLLAGIPQPFIAAGLGAKVEAKDWTEPNWTLLLREMSRRWPETGLVLLGSADEHGRSERCSRTWRTPYLNLCGKTTPRVSAAALKRAGLFIGHDSGPMHLAATVGTPCVAIFSARSFPGQWFPRGRRNTILYRKTDCFGCGLEVCVEQKSKCLKSITVAEVLTALDRYLPLSAGTPVGRCVPIAVHETPDHNQPSLSPA